VVEQVGPVRALVDGSLIEVFPGSGTPRTLRAYPVEGSYWRVEGPGLVVNELVPPAGA
jgi:hypothetical protein